MPAEFPKIAHSRHRRAIYNRDEILRGISPFGICLPCLVEHEINFCQAEPSPLDIKLEVNQALERDRQYLTVPASIERQGPDEKASGQD